MNNADCLTYLCKFLDTSQVRSLCLVNRFHAQLLFPILHRNVTFAPLDDPIAWVSVFLSTVLELTSGKSNYWKRLTHIRHMRLVFTDNSLNEKEFTLRLDSCLLLLNRLLRANRLKSVTVVYDNISPEKIFKGFVQKTTYPVPIIKNNHEKTEKAIMLSPAADGSVTSGGENDNNALSHLLLTPDCLSSVYGIFGSFSTTLHFALPRSLNLIVDRFQFVKRIKLVWLRGGVYSYEVQHTIIDKIIKILENFQYLEHLTVKGPVGERYASQQLLMYIFHNSRFNERLKYLYLDLWCWEMFSRSQVTSIGPASTGPASKGGGMIMRRLTHLFLPAENQQQFMPNFLNFDFPCLSLESIKVLSLPSFTPMNWLSQKILPRLTGLNTLEIQWPQYQSLYMDILPHLPKKLVRLHIRYTIDNLQIWLQLVVHHCPQLRELSVHDISEGWDLLVRKGLVISGVEESFVNPIAAINAFEE